MTENQITWIKQLKRGNELAAFNLYKNYSQAMYNTLIRITGDAQIAEDLLQDAFVKAFNRVNELRELQAFSGWLKQIVINAGLEYVRKRKFEFEDIELVEQLPEEDVDENLISDKVLHAAIKELPDGCRTVLSLFAIEGMKHKEIADQLAISESTSKSQFRHAKQLLREKLQHHYED